MNHKSGCMYKSIIYPLIQGCACHELAVPWGMCGGVQQAVPCASRNTAVQQVQQQRMYQVNRCSCVSYQARPHVLTNHRYHQCRSYSTYNAEAIARTIEDTYMAAKQPEFTPAEYQ
jgi:hypothetical protein